MNRLSLKDINVNVNKKTENFIVLFLWVKNLDLGYFIFFN
jgi:hypothetical protein